MENSISFPKLTFLELKDLQNLVKIYSRNWMIEFPSLEQLAIENCSKLKVPIVTSTSMDAMADGSPLFSKQVVFPNLERLELRSIEIKMIWHISATAHCIMNLTELTIEGCDNLELLFSSSMARGLKNLWHLEIQKCKNIREIIAAENVKDMENSISFPKLRFLKLKDLQNLVKIYSGNCMIEFPCSMQLAIKNCPKLKGPIVTSIGLDAMADGSPLFSKQVVFPKLEELKLRSIEIKMIWHISATAHCIMNLRKLTIEGCDNLELLFSSSMARGLKNLWCLEIQKCKNIREIIAAENVEDMENSISFPNLRFLELKDLQNLVKIYSGNCMIEFPCFMQLAMENCPKLKGPIVTSTSMDAMVDKSPLFSKQVVFPNLVKLELRSIEIKMIWHISATAHCIMNLTELTIEGCDNLELLLSSSMARGLKMLRHLKIQKCKNIREIIATDNVEDMENSISFPQLNFLELKDLENLVKFYSGNFLIEFPSKMQLAIENCPKLEVPIVTSTSMDAMVD
ncbi:hypothetical protein SLEP1_g1798 [Rubroshorea leprosula]|uniref:Disease resistance protein At4g27190-like leucine-rich repeats domain-containing protein n=1 Tax=Rubroshorea leprosula TaxID=152421 RepID=A0AAV5HF05_9ROSI|nr:hypothetical protein SLEP1_g1798 [Rubroshorea leprosula]